MHLITQGQEILLESGLGRRYPPSALQWGQVPRGTASWEREARPSLLEFQGTGSQRGCPEHSQGSGAPDSKLQSRRPQGAGHSERGGGGGTPTSSKVPPPEKTRGWRAKDRAGSSPATQTPSISGTCSRLWGESDHRGCVFVLCVCL